MRIARIVNEKCSRKFAKREGEHEAGATY